MTDNGGCLIMGNDNGCNIQLEMKHNGEWQTVVDD